MNTFGTIFKITIFGESHGKTMGIVLDGVVPGIVIDYEFINKEISRRKPTNSFETPRRENDNFLIVSGIINKDSKDYTTGAPLTILVENSNVKSSDYSKYEKHFRPGTSDFVSHIKYNGFNDLRGSGMFSGRLTVLLSIAGAISKLILPEISYESEVVSLANETNKDNFSSLLDNLDNNTVGGVVKVVVKNVPVGLGMPLFNKLTSSISSLMFSIPGVKGVVFGDALDNNLLYGNLFNDSLIDNLGKTKTNHSGGVNAGISNNNDLVVNVIVKPISSIGLPQDTYDFETNTIKELVISGRHDKTIVFRVKQLFESVLSIVILDHYLLNKYKNEDK